MDATQKRCAKFLIIFNGAFSVLGAIIVAIGVWLKLTSSQVMTTLSYVTSQLSTKDLFDIPIFLKYASLIIIAVGLYAIFISLLGFCGAMMRLKHLLYVYSLILFAFLLMQFGLGILGAVHKDKIVERARHTISQSLREIYRGPGATGENKEYSSSVDFLQVMFKCCGIKDGNDYQFNEWNRNYERTDTHALVVAVVPYTCCKLHVSDTVVTTANVSAVNRLLADPACPQLPNPTNSYLQQGCFNIISDFFSLYIRILIGVLFTFALLQLIGLVCALVLALRLQRFDETITNWALGHKVNEDGTIEQQDKFLKRMSGVIRLYAAILITFPPQKVPHPHGLEHAWIWLSQALSLHPNPEITATVNYDILQVTGLHC